jgi:carboxymethylenebutenolidase
VCELGSVKNGCSDSKLLQSLCLIIALFLLVSYSSIAAASEPDYPTPDMPQQKWWSDGWWDDGHIEAAQNYDVAVSEASYSSEGKDVPVFVYRPADEKKYPAVLFQHGRRGLDELVQGHAKRLAARGFVVFAPDIYSANFMDPYPLEHDPALEADVGAGVDALLARSDISSSRACLYSHTRGGYYTLKVAVTQGRQHTQLACYVSYYPHWQDPNAPEPLQVYGYAPEIDELRLPTMVFIGEKEQYQRRRPIDTGVLFLLSKKLDVSLFVYPGVGRGFDFRPKAVRTLADHLASKDALVRASRFMRKHLGNE